MHVLLFVELVGQESNIEHYMSSACKSHFVESSKKKKERQFIIGASYLDYSW